MQQSDATLKNQSQTNAQEQWVEKVELGAVEDVDRRPDRPARGHEGRCQSSTTREDFPEAHAL